MDSEALVRFKNKYKKRRKIHPELGTPCWLWTATLDKDGYGAFYVRREPGVWRYKRAHRVIYEHVCGPIPDGLEIDHLCRVKNCVNPDHLEAVTHAENVRRGEAGLHNPVKTHCPQGHPYSPENTLIIEDSRGDVWRRCKQCHADYERKRRNSIGTVEVWCDYCKATHTPLKTTHANNVRRNGEYRCRAYSTHLAAQKRGGQT